MKKCIIGRAKVKKKSKLKGKITKYILLGIIGIFLLTGLNNCAKDMAEIKREKAGEFIDMDNAMVLVFL